MKLSRRCGRDTLADAPPEAQIHLPLIEALRKGEGNKCWEVVGTVSTSRMIKTLPGVILAALPVHGCS